MTVKMTIEQYREMLPRIIDQRDDALHDRDALREALEDLSNAVSYYRKAHDQYGSGSIHTGMAWDSMRKYNKNADQLLSTLAASKEKR